MIDSRKAQSMGYEGALTARVTKRQAVDEMIRHYWDCCDAEEFGQQDGYRAAVETDLISYLGDHKMYNGGDVLELIGY